MYCAKCGKKIGDGSKFCAGCGNPVGDVSSTAETTGGSGAKKAGQNKGGRNTIIAIVAAAVAVVAIGVGGFFLISGRDSADSNKADGAEGTGTVAFREDEEPLYNITDVASIDLYAGNHTPGAKAPGIVWDSTLFYWLEDIDQTSSEDGYLARCRISKTLLRSTESGALIQYEIYRDPGTGEIYKIVSIEQNGGMLSLTDYYYQGGKPNFIFTREDSVYTPTYATPNKTGERFYFEGDVMAKWRMINMPGEIGEYVLTLTGSSYPQTDYFAESGEFQAAYDEKELQMLNAAYNTYEAVSSGQCVGLVDGVVQDTTGAAVGCATVDIRRKEDSALLYRAVTGEDGTFRMFTWLDGTECFLTVHGDAAFQDAVVYGVFLADSGLANSYGSLVLHRTDGDEYPVYMDIYAATDVQSGEDGSLIRERLSGATVSLREGSGARDGEVLETLQADGEGRVGSNLRSGIYTAQVDVPGYMTSYLEIEVLEGGAEIPCYVLPNVGEGTTAVVLTWEGDSVDLDLTVFTPWQSVDGDMAHIGGSISADEHGSFLVSDNSACCEVMYVNTVEAGSYKLYVNNYTDSLAGSYNSVMLGTLNVHIYIYDNTGLITEYAFPAGQSGVVWEVAELNNGQLTPSQRVYSRIEGKRWWLESKNAPSVIRTMVTQSESGEYAYITYTEYDEHGNEISKMSTSSRIIGRAADGTATYTETEQSYSYTYENVYDEYGNLITQTIYYNGKPSDQGSISYIYVNGQISEMVEFNYSWYEGDWSISGMGTFRNYDEQGRIISEHHDMRTDYWFYNETEEYITQFINSKFDGYGTLYIYDESGVLLREEWYWYDRYERVRRVQKEYIYDGNGNCVALRTWDEIGEWGEEWSYDEYGRLVWHEARYGRGAADFEETYIYNSLGQLESVYRNIFNGNYSDDVINYYYDAKGNLIKEERINYYDGEEYGEEDMIALNTGAWYDGSWWICSVNLIEYTYY